MEEKDVDATVALADELHEAIFAKGAEWAESHPEDGGTTFIAAHILMASRVIRHARTYSPETKLLSERLLKTPEEGTRRWES